MPPRSTLHRPPHAAPALSGRGGGAAAHDDFDDDDSAYTEHMSRFERSADRVLGRRVPYEDTVRPWEPQQHMPRRYMAPPPEPEQKEVLGSMSRNVLQIVVGDLAPHVEGALNFVANNSAAQSAATVAGVGLAALVLPRLMK